MGEKIKKSRQGHVKPPEEGKPAEFVGNGRAAAPVDFNPEPIADEVGLWWKSGTGNSFVVGSAEKGWGVWPEQGVTDKLRRDYAIAVRARENEMLSETKQLYLWVRENRGLDEIVPALPGYRSGVYSLESGERILVKTSPQMVEPEEGEWETIRKLISGQLNRSGESSDIDQVPYFLSWCKIALESLVYGEPGQWRQGHAMIIAGPAAGGKSRLQENVITPLLGGREANPKKFLFGQDDFNGDVFSAEHLSLAEVPSSQKSVDRVELAETIKQIVANSAQRMRLMRVEPWTVHPYWRLTITLNDDPDKLRSLPLVTKDFADKVLIFHSKKSELPMPTRTEPERKAFRDQIRSELPAFAHFLLNQYEIPESLLKYKDGSDATRFGFREFHHPIIRDGLFDDTPAAELLQLIDMAEFSDSMDKFKLWEIPSEKMGTVGKCWHGRAQDLHHLLTGEADGFTSSVDTMAKALFRHNKCATLLGRLNATDGIGDGVRVAKGDTREFKGWLIGPPLSNGGA